MDGENNGKPYFLMDDLGGKPTIFGNIHIYIYTFLNTKLCEKPIDLWRIHPLQPCFLRPDDATHPNGFDG